jgi:cytochrome oxidase Cu insertion factor (SCO1/SenC/PrrC family)
MSRTQKILTTMLWGLMVLIMVSVIGAGWWKRESRFSSESSVQFDGARGPQRGDVYFHVPAFSLVDQNNQPVTDQTFLGKPWIAAFIFTHCAGPCPMMSANMAKLQKRVPSPDLKLVSFTVDPERDTPEVLKEYAKSLGADESRWSFVTGSPETMTDVVKGMLAAFSPATETSDILHSTQFLLIDKAGDVRGIYGADEMESLAADAAKLVGIAPVGEPASKGGSPAGSSPTTQPGSN